MVGKDCYVVGGCERLNSNVGFLCLPEPLQLFVRVSLDLVCVCVLGSGGGLLFFFQPVPLHSNVIGWPLLDVISNIMQQCVCRVLSSVSQTFSGDLLRKNNNPSHTIIHRRYLL